MARHTLQDVAVSRRRQQGDGVARPQRQRAGRPRDARQRVLARDGRARLHAEQRGAAAQLRPHPHHQRRHLVPDAPSGRRAAARRRRRPRATASSTWSSTTSRPSRSATSTCAASRWRSGPTACSSSRCRHARRMRGGSRRRPSRSSSSTPTLPRSRACPTSSATTSRGGEAATRHLLELGHRRIAFLGDEFDNPFGFTSSRHRFAGYERALATAGMPIRAGPRRARARTAATRRASWPPGCWHARSGPAPSSPPATRRPWASSAPRTRPGCASPTTCRSSATTTSRSPTTWGSRPSASSCSNPGRLGAELLLAEIRARSDDAAVHRPAPRGRGPRAPRRHRRRAGALP